MEQIDVDSWEDFQAQIAALRTKHPGHRSLRFRGLADADWELTTTLERHAMEETAVDYYYRLISSVEPQIRSFIAEEWDEIEPYREINRMAWIYDEFHLYLWGGNFKALGYLAFLRHNGFPSPLMDWTRSPHIATFFAFRYPLAPPKGRVAIYAYCERPEGTRSNSSDRSEIFPFGPYVRTHRRHHLQQGEYTTCLQWDRDKGWRFVRHDTVFGRGSDTQDALWKFTLPWTERVKALKSLDEHNVNAFSLFESNEALLETLALRRLTLEKA